MWSQALPAMPAPLTVPAVESAWTRQLPDRLRSASSLPSETHLRIAPLTVPEMSGLTPQQPFKDKDDPPEPPSVIPPPPSSSLPPAYRLRALDSPQQTEYEVGRRSQELHDIVSCYKLSGQLGGQALVLLPHLLLPRSLFSGFVWDQPDGCLWLVDVTVREVGGEGRSLRSADCSQDEFDRRLSELGGAQAEAAEEKGGSSGGRLPVSLQVQGTLTGLAGFRCELYCLSPARLSFSAIVRPSSVPPLYYMQMLANRQQQQQQQEHWRLPQRTGPASWNASLRSWLEKRHEAQYAQLPSFNERHFAMQADMRALTAAELAEVAQWHQQQSREGDAWERQRRQSAVELAIAQSPNVRPLLCGLDDDSLCLRAAFHLTDSCSVPVIARGVEPYFSRDGSGRAKQPTLSFSLDTAANTDDSSSDDSGSSVQQGAAKKLKAEGAAAPSQLPINLPDVSAIFAYRRQRLYRSLPVRRSRPGESGITAEEFVQLLQGPLCGSASAAAAAVPAPLSASHLLVADFNLRYGTQASESFCLVLSSSAAAPRCPLLDCELTAPRLRVTVNREPPSQLINPLTGYSLSMEGAVVVPAASASSSRSSSSSAAAPAVRIAVTSDKPAVATFDSKRVLTVSCDSGEQLCSLYDRLYARWLADADSSAQQTAAALPLVDCLQRCFPALSMDDSAAHSVECRMDESSGRMSALLLRRLQLVLFASPGAQPSPPFRCVLSTRARFGQPDTPQQRLFSLVPLQEGRAPLQNWVAACAFSLLIALPELVREQTDFGSVGPIGTVRAVLKLNRDGQASFVISEAACGPRETDRFIAVQLYETAVELASKSGSCQLVSPLRSFALLRQSELLTPRLCPQLHTAAQGRALEPLCCFVCADTGGVRLGEEQVRRLQALVARALGPSNGGADCCLKGIPSISHQPEGAFLLLQPHLPDGQLVVSAGWQSSAQAATDAARDASPAALPEATAGSSLLPRLMAVPQVFHLVLDLLDLNDVAHALVVVCRSSKQQLAPLFPAAVLSVRYWSLSAPARFQRWADPWPLHWEEPVLSIRRDRLIARRQLETRPACCRALQSLPVHYAAAVELQSRINTFRIAVMRQPPFLVLPQLHETPAALRAPASQSTTRHPLHPAFFTSLPDVLLQLQLITPAFCADQRPRELGSTTMHWTEPARDSSWQTAVQLPRSAAGAEAPASYVQHDWLRNLGECRLDGDGDSIWSAFTGPVYAYDDGSRTAADGEAQRQETKEAEAETVAGLRLTAEQANAVIARHWHWHNRPAPTVSLPVRLRYPPSLQEAPVVRHMPNIDGTKLHVYCSSIASCLQAKKLLDDLQQYREQWRHSAQRLQDDEKQRQQAQHTADEGVVVHERIQQVSGEQEMDVAMSGEVIALEQQQEEAGERPLPAFRVCVPLQDALLAQLGVVMRLSDDWKRSAPTS